MTPELVFCVAFGPDGFLMVHNRDRGGWEFPGGRVEAGESAEAAARREFTEETGRDIVIVAQEEDPKVRAVIFYGTAGEREGPITDPAIDEADFFTEPPQKLVFGLAECLYLLEKGLRILVTEAGLSERIQK